MHSYIYIYISYFVYIYIFVTIIYTYNVYKCIDIRIYCGFACHERVVKMLPGPGYLCSEDEIV